MPRKSNLLTNNAGKGAKNRMKISKFNAILRDFDTKVASRLEELDDKKKEYCDEITEECNAILARIPKSHQNMLLLDYIDMKNRAEEEKNTVMQDLNDEVFEAVAEALPKTTATPLFNGPATSTGSRSPQFLKPSTLKRTTRHKKTAASAENLMIAGQSNQRQRMARSRSAKERSASESRAESRTGRKRTTTKAVPNVLSGAFSAIRSHSQQRGTPDTKLSTPLRKCRSGERCLILSESGSPMSSGTEPTIVLPAKDGALVTFSSHNLDTFNSRNLDILDDETRENLMLMHKKLGDLLDRKH